MEFIVVDNGSLTAEQQSIVQTNYSWVHFIFLQENFGPSHARNVGLKLSTGKFIQFIDDDDLITFGKLKHQSQFLLQNQLVDVVIGPTQKTAWDLLNYPLAVEDKFYLPDFRHSPSCEDLIKTTGFFQIASALFRKPVLQQVHGFDEKRWFIEDVNLYLRLLKNKAVFFVDNNCPFGLFWRLNENNISLGTIDRSGFLDGCLLNYFFCIEHDLIQSNTDLFEVYSGIFSILLQREKVTLRSEALKHLNSLDNVERKTIFTKFYWPIKILGINTTFRIYHQLRRWLF